MSNTNDKLPSAVDVAAYVLWLAEHDPEQPKRGLTPKELQKLLYYIQGWSLGQRDTRVFDEQLEAWRDGPVVPSVYSKSQEIGGLHSSDGTESIPSIVRAFIASVWEDYKWQSERELIANTHRERPWADARRGYKPHEPSDVPIPDAALRALFSQPAANQLTQEQLRLIAARPSNAPPPEWYAESE